MRAFAPNSRLAAKTSHWMWFIFPHCEASAALRPPTASASRAGRKPRPTWRIRYWAPRLRGARGCARVEGRTQHEIFGTPDDLKFHSSMTLFATVAPEEPLFRQALDRYFDSRPDTLTEQMLGGDSTS